MGRPYRQVDEAVLDVGAEEEGAGEEDQRGDNAHDVHDPSRGCVMVVVVHDSAER